MTGAELRKIHKAALRDQARARASEERRNTAFREALKDPGWTQSKIAREVGLTRGRVNQIVAP